MGTEFRISTSDGVALAGVIDGAGGGAPSVLFLNSIGCDQRMWAAQAEALAPDFQTVRFDTRGHGRSDAPPGEYGVARLGQDVLDLMDALSIRQAALCGLSLGGLIAQWVAVTAPERISSLVLANTASRIGSPDAWRARQAAVRDLGMHGLAEMALGRFFSPAFLAAGPPEVELIRRALIGTSPEGYVGCCAALRDADLTPELHRIEAPALVIGGGCDISTPPDQTADLAARIGGAEHLVLDAAHLSNLERPQAFTDALRRHLRPEP